MKDHTDEIKKEFKEIRKELNEHFEKILKVIYRT